MPTTWGNPSVVTAAESRERDAMSEVPGPPPGDPPVRDMSKEKKDKKKDKKDKKDKKMIKKMSLEEAPLEAAQLVEAPPEEKEKNTEEHKADGGPEEHKDGQGKEDGQEAPPVRNPATERTMVVPSDPKPPDHEPGEDKPKKKKKGKFALGTSLEDAAKEEQSRPTTPRRPLTRVQASQRHQEEIDEAAIHDYAWKGEFIAMEELIGMRGLKDDKGKNYIRFLDSRDKQGNTALMLAATRGFHSIVQMLIKAGANIDLQNFYGWTAIMFAVSEDNEHIVQLLLEHNANLRLLTPVDRGAIDFASSSEVRKMLRDVLDRPVKIDEKLLLKDGEADDLEAVSAGSDKLLLKN